MALSLCTGAASAAGPYDGAWVGQGVLQPGSSGNCIWRGPLRVRITDGKIDQEIGRASMKGTVTPDGSVSASGPIQLNRVGVYTGTFTGRISGPVMNAMYRTQYCTFAFTMRKQ